MKKTTILLLAILCGIPLVHTKAAVPADRWIEMDLSWFKRDDMRKSAEQFWDGYHPLFDGLDGWKGVILNIGWIPNYIFLWNGDLNQEILLPTTLRMETGFKAEGMLEGTALERIELARRRFRDMNPPIIVKYEKWTYGDLKKLVQAIKAVASTISLATAARVPGSSSDTSRMSSWLANRASFLMTSA